MDETLTSKTAHLKEMVRDAGSLVVAYSGGVDSTFLLAVAHEVLQDRVLAVTAVSSIHPRHEQEAAREFVHTRKIEHLFLQSREMSLPAFRANHRDRCYECKKALSLQLLSVARERGIGRVAHGATVDDLGDFRPGLRAAREMNIWAPLVEAGFCKDEIRKASKAMGLPQWDKPSGACLATRIPYDSPITEEKLETIEAAERFLLHQGLRQCRVRHHGDLARIEAEPEGTQRMMQNGLREAVVAAFKELGFIHIALDLEFYGSGRMNRALGIDTAGGNENEKSEETR